MCAETVDPGVSKTAERPDQTSAAQQPRLQTTLAALLAEHLNRRAAQTFPHHAPDE
jgi:hypothetical protein